VRPNNITSMIFYEITQWHNSLLNPVWWLVRFVKCINLVTVVSMMINEAISNYLNLLYIISMLCVPV
jgi:hypothetical protein